MTVDVNLSQTINDFIKSRFTNNVSDSIQRLTSGLSINDSADDVGGQISSTRLNNFSSSLKQGIENGNSGLALVQVSDKALDKQVDILNTIKAKLDFVKDGATSAAGIEVIRTDINTLLTQLDSIASNTNYNSSYTLQKSNSDNDFSLSASILLDDNSGNSVSTPSIKSNTSGLSLDTLKNLTSGGLSELVAAQQSTVVTTAISTIESYSDSFDLTQTEIGISIENLTNIEKTTSESKADILTVSKDKENAILDKYRLLEKASEFAIVQANITQATALRLLTDLSHLNSDITDNNKANDINNKTDKNEEKTNFNKTSNYDNFYTTSYETNSYKPKTNNPSSPSTTDSFT